MGCEDLRTLLGPYLALDSTSFDPSKHPRGHGGRFARHGMFGPVYTQFRHDASGAIAHLRKTKSGEAVAALHHPDVGDIDLVWGEVGDPARGYRGGYGLSKIEAKHPEVLRDLQGFVSSLRVSSRDNTWITLESNDGKGVVRLDWDGQKKHWLVSAYEKKKAGGRTTSDTAALDGAGDTARRATDFTEDYSTSQLLRKALRGDCGR